MTAKPTYEALEKRIRDLEARREALVYSERWLEAIFNALEEAVLVVQPDRKIIRINTAGQNMFEYTTEELAGHSTEMLHVDHEHYQQFGEKIQKAFRSGKTAVFEFWGKSKTGRIFPSRHTVSLLTDEAGAPLGIVSVVRDLSEEKRLREESRRHLEQAIRADRLAALGEVVAGVAHEINNPNSFITFNLPLLADIWEFMKPLVGEYALQHPETAMGRIPLEELARDVDDILRSLQKGSERISQVVGKLKNFALPDESQKAQPTRINQVVEDTMAIFSGKLKKHAESFQFVLGENLPAVLGYPFKLEQVLANLILNASHAVGGGSNARILISTRYCEALNAVLLEVEDNGKGMTREEINKIFDPFHTTRRKEGGSGLGLSITHKILKEHNALMGVLSRPGVGSRFTVFLPVKAKEQLSLDPVLLIIDDDVNVLKLLSTRFLKLDKRFVHKLTKPESVVSYLAAHPEVDLVISDISMPGMTGWQLLEEIKRHDSLMPVILFSGLGRALENPFVHMAPDALVEKPFQRDALLELIHKISRMKI